MKNLKKRIKKNVSCASTEHNTKLKINVEEYWTNTESQDEWPHCAVTPCKGAAAKKATNAFSIQNDSKNSTFMPCKGAATTDKSYLQVQYNKYSANIAIFSCLNAFTCYSSSKQGWVQQCLPGPANFSDL